MIKKIISPLILSFFLLANQVFSAGTLASVSGVYSETETITLNGSSLGTRSDNGGSESYLQFKFDTFDDNSTVQDTFTYSTASTSLETTNQRTGSIKHVQRDNGTSVGGVGVSSSSTNDGYFTSFWCRIPASVTFSATGQVKLNRTWYGTGSNNYPNYSFIKHFFTSSTQFLYKLEIITSGEKYLGNSGLFADGNWHYIETWFKPSTGIGNTDGQYDARFDGTDFTNWTSRTDDEGRNTFGGWWRIFDYYFGASGDCYIDDACFDYTRSQVYICNSNTFSSASHRELQELLTWSATEITFKLNTGSFSSGDTVYVFATDSSGNPSNALSFVIDEESGVPPNPDPDPGDPITEKRIVLNGVTIELNGVTITYD